MQAARSNHFDTKWQPSMQDVMIFRVLQNKRQVANTWSTPSVQKKYQGAVSSVKYHDLGHGSCTAGTLNPWPATRVHLH